MAEMEQELDKEINTIDDARDMFKILKVRWCMRVYMYNVYVYMYTANILYNWDGAGVGQGNWYHW